MKKLHYITAVTHNRVPVFQSETACRIFIDQLREIKETHPFELIGYVLMPDHFHMLVRLPDDDVEKFLLRLRGLTARKIIAWLKSGGYKGSLLKLKLPAVGRRKTSYAVWQPKPLVVDIYTVRFLKQKLDYIHMNPVRAGLCKTPGEWRWSSYNAYLGAKDVPIDVDWSAGGSPRDRSGFETLGQ